VTRADRILLVVLVAITVMSAPLVTWAMPAKGAVSIVGPYGTTQVDPNLDSAYRVEGRLGTVTVVVRDGAVFCSESECPDEVCVHSGDLAAGRPIVCAPNGVVVMYAAPEKGALDAVSR